MKKFRCNECQKSYRPRIRFSSREGLWWVYVPYCQHSNFIARGYTRRGAKNRWVAYLSGKAFVNEFGLIQYNDESVVS